VRALDGHRPADAARGPSRGPSPTLLLLVRADAALSLLLGGLLVAGGVIAGLGSMGASGLGAVFGFALAIGALVLGAGPVALGLSLLGAMRSVANEGPAPASTGMRVTSTLVAVVTLVVWVLPIWAILTFHPGDPAWGTVAAVGLVIGAGTAIGAWFARHVSGKGLSTALLLIAMLGLVIPGWEATSMTTTAAQQATYAEQEAAFAARYADIASGPHPDQFVPAVGDVGSWRVVSGGEWPDRYLSWDAFEPCCGWNAAMAHFSDLAGKRVRFLFVGECWVEGDPGRLDVSVMVRGQSLKVEDVISVAIPTPLGPCDRAIGSTVSEAVVLPAWGGAGFAAAVRDGILPVSWNVNAVAAQPGPEWPERAARWLLFVSVDPATSVDDVVAAVSRAVPPLVIQ
jgi:hypothetical protein